MTRCAIYARVSSDGQSTSMQLSQLRPYMELRQWQSAPTPAQPDGTERLQDGSVIAVPYRVGEYVDEGISGAKTSRPRLNDLMADIKKGKIDIVLVWKFDRMGRNTVHLVSVLDYLRAHGVEFCSFTEQIDTSSALGKCLMTIIAALAELERSNILMRSRAGIANARRKGVKFGRPKAWSNIPATVIEFEVQRMGSLRKAAPEIGMPLTTLRSRWKEIQGQREDAHGLRATAGVSESSGVVEGQT